MTSYLSENEAENLQNGDVHLAKIPDFEIGYLGALRLVRAHYFAFFTLFHLSLTFFRPEFPFKNTGCIHSFWSKTFSRVRSKNFDGKTNKFCPHLLL